MAMTTECGIKLLDMKVTPEEFNFIEHIRAVKSDFCRIELVIYVQDGKLFRTEAKPDNIVESWMLKDKSS
jgi:hypothetical protein